MDDKIFKKYDIRGTYPDQLDEETAFLVGRAYTSFLGENPVLVVGRDGRKSSPNLFEKLKEGIIASGGDVIDIGLSNTPLLNFTLINQEASGGIMVTASHNPTQFNGFKLIKSKGLQIYGKEIKKIKKIIKNEEFIAGKGKIIKKDPLANYLSHILSFDSSDALKVVVDYGNGVGSITGKPAFEKMNVEVVSLFDQIDGSFPNHLPNPTPENMKKLKEKVKKEKADLGVFFDGDGDRAFFVDDNGEMLYPDVLISLLIKEELSNRKEKRVYFDLRFSKTTAEKISEAGGIPEMMKVGNPFYKEKLIKEGGLMGAELSGHIMHCDNFSIDDGLFIAVKLINFLSEKNKKLSEMIKPLKKYYQSEEINMRVEDKDKALKKVRESFPGGVSFDLDGVYIDFDNWWFNLRKSNTEDLVRLRLEADSEKLLEEKTKEIVSLIKEL